MDEWSFLDEVDVISKWPAEHKKFVLEGGKWSERKAGLEALNQLIEQNPRLSTATMTIYGELMDEIRKILDRESNIVVVTTAVRTVELLAKGLRVKFAGFIGMVLPFLIKRAKDKKKNVRDAILAAVSALSDTASAERLQKDIVDWFAIPSPESKQTLLAFLFAYFCRQNAVDVPVVKTIAPLMVKSASESDVTVRDKACQALGSLKRLMGDSISAFLGPISTDTAKLEKIGQYEQEAVEEWKQFMASRPAQPSESASPSDSTTETSEQGPASSSAPSTASIDPWTLLDPEDVAKKMDKAVEGQLVDKQWKERVAGAEAVKKEVEAVGRIEISERLVEIMKLMVRIIEKDVNVNVASLAAQTLAAVALRARFAYASMANRGFPVVFDKLKDKKAVLRDALNELCDVAATTTPLSTYMESVISALSSKNPQTRQQTALFLSRFFSKNDQTTVEIETVKQLAEPLLKATNDADKEVREAALRAVAALQKSLGEAPVRRLLADVFDDKLKAEKVPAIVEEMEKEFGKSASQEMVRLAKQFGVAQVQKKPVAPKPVAAARPVQSATQRVPSVTRTAPAPRAPVKPVAAAPRPIANGAPAAPKPFVARPAPNFGASKPKIAVKPVVKPTVAPAAATRPISRVPAAPRPPTATATTRSVRAPQPIAPNVVRNGSVPMAGQKPIGIARPQTASGIVAPRSRIVAPPTSGIARPPSTSRIARPPSRPGSRNENRPN